MTSPSTPSASDAPSSRSGSIPTTTVGGGASSGFAHSLEPEALAAVARGQLLGIHHRGYLEVAPLAGALDRLRALLGGDPSEDRQPASFGKVVGDALQGEAGRARYLAATLDQSRALRLEIFAPYLSPLDRLRLDLDELWPHGATVARLDGRPMSAGTVRRFRVGDLMNPHVDHTGETFLAELCRERRLAANLYLEVPEPGQGGELELWERTFTSEELPRYQLADYSLDRRRIGAPDRVLRPAAGDLVLFDTARVHAVAEVRGGSRITASCFIGVRGPGESLVLFA